MSSTYKAISTTTLSSAAQVVSISNIPQTFTDLVLVINHALDSQGSIIINTINNDASSGNRSTLIIRANGSQTQGTGTGGQTLIQFSVDPTTPTTRSSLIVQFLNYSNTITFKPILGFYTNPGSQIALTYGAVGSTAAITQVTFRALTFPQFVAGSTFSLYGIKAL